LDVLRGKADLLCDQSVAQALTLPLARNCLLVDAEVFGNLGFGVQLGQINNAHETFLLGLRSSTEPAVLLVYVGDVSVPIHDGRGELRIV
jgi:hypothetical protein